MEVSFPWVAGAIVGALFLVTGVFELINWRKFVELFVGWGYPRYWPIVTYALKIVAGVMVFVPQTRLIGLTLAVMICLAAATTLIVKRDAPMLKKALPVNALLILLAAYAGLSAG